MLWCQYIKHASFSFIAAYAEYCWLNRPLTVRSSWRSKVMFSSHYKSHRTISKGSHACIQAGPSSGPCWSKNHGGGPRTNLRRAPQQYPTHFFGQWIVFSVSAHDLTGRYRWPLCGICVVPAVVSGRWSMLVSSESILSDFTYSGQLLSKNQCRGGVGSDWESSVAARCCIEWRPSDCWWCLSAC